MRTDCTFWVVLVVRCIEKDDERWYDLGDKWTDVSPLTAVVPFNVFNAFLRTILLVGSRMQTDSEAMYFL